MNGLEIIERRKEGTEYMFVYQIEYIFLLLNHFGYLIYLVISGYLPKGHAMVIFLGGLCECWGFNM